MTVLDVPPATRTALVVDDSSSMRSILARLLGSIGWTCRDAADGRRALDVLRTGWVPDVLLVDWNMPVMSGLDLLRAVRAEAGYARVRLLVVSSECDPIVVGQALDAGADEYLVKPFTADALASKLDLVARGRWSG
jgi:two-component system, chemotaxis family, chemotaxis protein CheY